MVRKAKVDILKNKKHFETIIIGGGINGIGVFRELSLHGQEVLLLDAYDFCSQTSSKSSKMLHGGIRYLEQWQFDLVLEAQKEKNIWHQMTPHLCQKKNFYIPIFQQTKYPKFMIMIGLKLYDALSGYQNFPSKVIGAGQVKEQFPLLRTQGLMGSGIYEDIIVDDARLGIECLVDALYEKNSYALNYHPVIDIDYRNGDYHLSVQDSILQNDYHITCKNLIMTTGPFSNPLLKKWNLHPPVIKPSKGVHLWFDHEDLPISSPLVFQTPDQRILFLIPQRSHVLVGTTDTPFHGQDLFNPQVTDHDINYLFSIMHEFFHDLKITPKDIKGSFAGLRPLVPQNIHIQNSSKISRKHQIFQFHPNGFLLVGGKYTTFRVMAQDLMFKMYRQLGIQYNPTLSLNKLRYQPLYRPDINHRSLSIVDILKIIENEQVKTLDDLLLRRLSFIGLADKRLGPIKKILGQLKSEHHWDLEPPYQLIV